MTTIWTAGVRRAVLANGLRVLVQPVSGSPAVAIVTRIAAGFFDEPDEWSGISHVLEHMFFKGTPSRGVGDIARATRSVGGYLNASTAYDHTSYYAVLPARALSTALEVQADALRNTLLDAGDLSREIQVIIEEARRKLDTASAVAQETLHQILFDRHRIRRWRIGTEAGLLGLTRDDLASYHSSRYVPERTIVAIAGGIDADITLDLVEQLYGDWRGPQVVLEPGPDEPPRTGIRVKTLRGDVQQAQLVIGWRGVSTLHADAIPLDIAAAVLALGRGSWLYRTVRDSGIASSVAAFNYSPFEVGVFSVAAELETDRLDDAIGEFGASIGALRQRGPSPEDLERVQVLLRARWARRFESAEGRATELAAAEGASDVALLDREYARTLEVTVEEVRAAVNRHLDPQRVAGVAFLPLGKGGDITATSFSSAFERVSPPTVTFSSTAALPPPARMSCSVRRIGEVRCVALPGVDLLVRQRVGTPTATVAVYRHRWDADPPHYAGLATLAVRSAVRGAGGVDGNTLTDRFERLGGTLGISIGSEHYGFSTTVLADHAAEAAGLLRSVLHEPRLTTEDIVVERRLLEDDARQAADDMYQRPIRLAMRAAFGSSGLGLPLLGFPDTVRGILPEVVRSWHTRGLAAGRTTVVAVGDFEPERLLEQLASMFSLDPTSATIETDVATEWVPTSAPRQVIELREKAQTGLALLFHGPGWRDPDRHAALVWAAHSGGLGGRLFQSLRDTHSLAYTVSAFAWQRRTVGGLVTYIGTSPGREEEARRRLLEEIHAFGERPPEDQEVADAIEYLVGQAEVRRQSAAAMVSEIATHWLLGSTLDELVDPGSGFRRVTPADVLGVARNYLAGQPHAEGLVRGQASSGNPERDAVTF